MIFFWQIWNTLSSVNHICVPRSRFLLGAPCPTMTAMGAEHATLISVVSKGLLINGKMKTYFLVSWCLFFSSLRTTIVNLFCLDAGICSINLIDWFFFVIKGPPACSVPGGCPWMKKYNYFWILSWYSLLHMHARLSCNKV